MKFFFAISLLLAIIYCISAISSEHGKGAQMSLGHAESSNSDVGQGSRREDRGVLSGAAKGATAGAVIGAIAGK
ncbi:unnamed protein product [Strongylus vulgaris]|uniref:Glycine zipper 2TM domain-containing protein n=1 Tax=Strongylus vulgaris TaxID=40348 RepID=A0A3P7J314_STRVU|nr:unnamed protein product [Strongylus vulgaris]VDM81419.1 unnamed protein product [Strongylus vulgaris]